MFTYTKVEKDEDLISLYDESYGRKLLTLRQMSTERIKQFPTSYWKVLRVDSYRKKGSLNADEKL